jgi:mRNA interferase HigB
MPINQSDIAVMHVISKKKLRLFWTIQSLARNPLDNWFRVTKKSDWSKFADIRATFGSADEVGKYTVFNVGGNKYWSFANSVSTSSK